jgi:hypothetical protein
MGISAFRHVAGNSGKRRNVLGRPSVLSGKSVEDGAGPVCRIQGARSAAIAALSQGMRNAGDGRRGQARFSGFP